LFESSFSLAESAGFEFLAIDALHMLANVAPAEDRVVLNERALALATAAKDPRAREWRASLLNNLGWARFDGGDFAAALRLFSDAAGERERQGNAREIGVARWCVGRTLRALGRTEEALETQVELAAWLSSVGLSDSYVEEEIGECLSELDREEEARHHFGQAARLLAAGGPGEIADPKRLAALQSRATATSVYTSTTPEPTSG
jgi:tetratricopeptide (TPR) repeat protein